MFRSCSSSAAPSYGPDFALDVWYALTAVRLVEIARVFIESPYDLRAGWPDLTMIDGGCARFVEVKTTDEWR